MSCFFVTIEKSHILVFWVGCIFAIVERNVFECRIMVCRIIFNCNLKWDLNPIATYPDKIESDFVYFGFSE